MAKWENDPLLSSVDPAKLAMLQSFVNQGNFQSQNDILPLLMKAATSSKKQGMQFTPEETELIIKVLKKGKSPKEIEKMDRILMLMKMLK